MLSIRRLAQFRKDYKRAEKQGKAIIFYRRQAGNFVSGNKNVDAAIHTLKKLVPEFNPQNELYKEVLKKGSESVVSKPVVDDRE